MSKTPPADAAHARPANLRDLFYTFTRLTLSGFGGVLPFAHRVLVQEQGWLDEPEFLRLLAISQVLPGPNLLNLSILVGQRAFGWRGAVAALSGMLAAPLLIVLAVGAAAAHGATVPWVGAALRGLELVSAALVLAMAARMLPLLRARTVGMVWAAAAFGAVGLAHWPLLPVMAVLGPAAALVAWHHPRESAS